MLTISDDAFAALIDEVMAELPPEHMKAVKNVAITYADNPTPEQAERLRLRQDQSLFGLYEGVPLTKRQGNTNFPPDRITIFKEPILRAVNNYAQLREQVKHTLWHEIAHYFGLDHTAIHSIENKWHS